MTLWYFLVEKVLVIPSQQLVFFPNLLMPNSSYVEHFTCTGDSLVSRRVLIIDGFENNSPLRIQFVKFSVLGTDWIFAPLLSGQTGRDHCILILCWVSPLILWSDPQTGNWQVVPRLICGHCRWMGPDLDILSEQNLWPDYNWIRFRE